MRAISFLSVCWSLFPWKRIYSYAAYVPSWGGCGRGWHSCGTLRSSGLVCTHFCSLRWQWQLMPIPRAHLGNALWDESTSLEKEGPGVPPPLSSCTSQQCWLASLVGPGFFLYFLVYGTSHPSSLGGFPAANPSCSPGLTSGVRASAVSPHPALWRSILGFGVPDSSPAHLCRSPSALPSVIHLLCSPPRLQSSPSCPGWCLCHWRDFPGCKNFSSFTAPSQGPRAHPTSFLSFFFGPTQTCLLGSLRSSASTQQIFCENCSTHKCICDVLMTTWATCPTPLPSQSELSEY